MQNFFMRFLLVFLFFLRKQEFLKKQKHVFLRYLQKVNLRCLKIPPFFLRKIMAINRQDLGAYVILYRWHLWHSQLPFVWRLSQLSKETLYSTKILTNGSLLVTFVEVILNINLNHVIKILSRNIYKVYVMCQKLELIFNYP